MHWCEEISQSIFEWETIYLHTGHSDIQRILKGYYIKLKFLFYEESLLARYCNTMTISVWIIWHGNCIKYVQTYYSGTQIKEGNFGRV